MSTCEWCKEELAWCTCPTDCADGHHLWEDNCAKCKKCLEPREAKYKSKIQYNPIEEKLEEFKWANIHDN